MMTNLLLCPKPNLMQLSMSDDCEVVLISTLTNQEQIEGWQKMAGTFSLRLFSTFVKYLLPFDLWGEFCEVMLDKRNNCLPQKLYCYFEILHRFWMGVCFYWRVSRGQYRYQSGRKPINHFLFSYMLIYFEASIFGNSTSQGITYFWPVKLELQKHKQFFFFSLGCMWRDSKPRLEVDNSKPR